MLNFRQMSEKASDIIDGQTTMNDRLSAHMHLLLCTSCRRYYRQLRLTITLLRRSHPSSPPADVGAVIEALHKSSPTTDDR